MSEADQLAAAAKSIMDYNMEFIEKITINIRNTSLYGDPSSLIISKYKITIIFKKLDVRFNKFFEGNDPVILMKSINTFINNTIKL